jgi:S1-C subfamily serine protease
MKPFRIAFAVAIIAALTTAPQLTAQDPEFKHSQTYDRCVKSAVFIVTPMKQGMAMGSGSLIDAEKRYVLTNYHVVDEVPWVFVQFPVRNKDGSLMTDKKKYIERIPAGQAIKGKVLHIDKTRDLAIVQLEKLPPDTPALPLAKISVKTGEPVFNIGNPGAVDWTFSTTQGTVRGVGVADMVVGGGGEVLRIKARMVTVTNPINPGDSGGPLIDRRGYQVGVAESGRSGVQNVNNCVDITEVWGFLNEKKITIKDLTNEKDPPKPDPKLKSNDTPPKNGSGNTPPPKVDTPPGPGVGSAAPPSAEEEKAADMLLRRAKVFADGEDNRDFYKGKLKEIVTKHPGTTAAKEAQKILNTLK